MTQSFLPPSSPSGQSSPAVSLYGDRRPADPGVSGPGQPSSDAALDDHGSNTQLLRSKPLQKGHLTSTEEYFGLSEAELVRVWDELRQSLSAGGLGLIQALRASEQKAVPAEELLVRPSGHKDFYLANLEKSQDSIYFNSIRISSIVDCSKNWINILNDFLEMSFVRVWWVSMKLLSTLMENLQHWCESSPAPHRLSAAGLSSWDQT